MKVWWGMNAYLVSKCLPTECPTITRERVTGNAWKTSLLWMIKVNITSNGLYPNCAPWEYSPEEHSITSVMFLPEVAWPECRHKSTDTSRMRYILQNKRHQGLERQAKPERLLNVTCGSGVDHCKGHYWEIEWIEWTLRLDSSNSHQC